jgi:5'-deoxynucleotidase YfbR-like HD superfamily hydrolase
MRRAITMQTASGKLVDLLDPNPHDIVIEDIAHHLARLNRFGGATAYTVAQHSVLVSRLCTKRPLAALLHDAHEAYLGDWIQPVQAALRVLGAGEPLDELRRRIDEAVAIAFKLDPADFHCPEIKQADRTLLATEFRDLMRHTESGLPPPLKDPVQPYVYAPGVTQQFLNRFYEITETCGA